MEEDFSEYIKKSWADGRDQVSIPARLSQRSGDLKVWAGNRFDQLGRQIKLIRKEVNRLSSSNVIKENMSRIAELEKKVEKLSVQEETH